MKNNFVVLAVGLFLLIVLGTACGHKGKTDEAESETDTVTDYEDECDGIEYLEYDPAFFSRKKLEIVNSVYFDIHDEKYLDTLGAMRYASYDSTTYADGSYTISILGLAPLNSFRGFYDKNGRIYASISSGSETYPQFLIYGYDEKGRLKYLLRYNERLNCPTFYDGCDDTLQAAIAYIDFTKPNLERHIVSELMYDASGIAYELREYPSGKNIKAPKGYRLKVSADPCIGFWSSDLSGGRFVLNTCIEPIKKTLADYSFKHFIDFVPTTEEYYRNGKQYKMVRHAEPGVGDTTFSVTLRTESNRNIYAKHYEKRNDTLISIWQNGCLEKQILKSKWGTVLNEKRFSYLPSGKVKQEEWRYDYKARKLKPAMTKLLNPSDLMQESDMLSPL